MFYNIFLDAGDVKDNWGVIKKASEASIHKNNAGIGLAIKTFAI